MKRLITLALLLIVTLLQVPDANAKKPKVLRAPGGSNIGSLGLMIDASYDPRLDALVPGYKVINVAIVNQSFNIIYLDPEKDKWEIKLATERKPIKVIHDLRSANPKAWNAMPKRARGIVGYPLVLPIGAREVIDVFVPDTVDVTEFTEISIYLKSLNTKLEILARQ